MGQKIQKLQENEREPPTPRKLKEKNFTKGWFIRVVGREEEEKCTGELSRGRFHKELGLVPI